MKQRFATVISSGYDKDKFLGIQIDAYGDAPGVPHTRLMHPLGFMARPLDPTSNTDGMLGCIAYQLSRGTAEEFAYLAHDPRDVGRLPPLSQGSSLFYNSSGAWVYLDYATQSERHYIPYIDGGVTKAHSVTIGKDSNGKPTVEIRHGDAQYLALKDDGAELRGSGNAYFQAKGDACTLNGNGKVTGSLDVAGGTLPVAMAPALIEYLTAAETLWGTIAAATQPSTAAAVTAFLVATAALKAAISSTMLKAL